MVYDGDLKVGNGAIVNLLLVLCDDALYMKGLGYLN